MDRLIEVAEMMYRDMFTGHSIDPSKYWGMLKEAIDEAKDFREQLSRILNSGGFSMK